MLPMVPVGFPVPSYASEAFLAEAERWFALVGAELAPLRYPDGADRALPDRQRGGALLSRRALRSRLPPRSHRALSRISAGQVRAPKRRSRARTARAPSKHRRDPCPPRSSTDRAPTSLAWHLDWVEFQEQLRRREPRAHEPMRSRSAGLDGMPTIHNMTMGYEATPLVAARIGARGRPGRARLLPSRAPRPIDCIDRAAHHRAGHALRRPR